jgi:alkylation response protein AidB-like acyl-CoA dehydrogenase
LTTAQDTFIGDLEGSIADFLDTSVPTKTLRALADGAGFSPELWSAAAEMGWFRLLLAEEDGGFDFAPSDVGFLFACVGERPFPGPLLDHVIVAPFLARHAVGAVRERLLEAADGSRLVSLVDPAINADPAVGEWDVTWNRAALTGEVPYVRYGSTADDLLVFAKQGEQSVIVLVERNRDGIDAIDTPSMDLAGRYSVLRFSGVAVTDADVVAGGSDAAELAATVRATLRLMIACELSCLAHRMFTMALDYTKVRQQFGRVIGSFQAIKHILADMYMRVDALRNVCAAARADAGKDPGLLAGRATVAKAYAAHVGRTVAEDALQVHGGIGFTVEHDLHLYLKRALALQGAYGDERELARHLGRELIRGDAETITA